MDNEPTVDAMFSLAGKTAVVTGASGAIGGAVARGFAAAGADLALIFNSNRTAAERLADDARGIGRRAEIYQVDIRLDSAVAENAERVAREFGKTDVLFNCAGGNIREAITDGSRGFFDLTPAAISDTMDLNFMGATILPCLHYGESMIGSNAGGSIINVSSMNSFRPLEGRPAYAASKAAVSNFTQWLACHIAKQYTAKVRVNAIAAGFFPEREDARRPVRQRWQLFKKRPADHRPYSDGETRRRKGSDRHGPVVCFGCFRIRDRNGHTR